MFVERLWMLNVIKIIYEELIIVKSKHLISSLILS